MPLHLERIDWMPSPPLAPDDGPIDNAHLGSQEMLSLPRTEVGFVAAVTPGAIRDIAAARELQRVV